MQRGVLAAAMLATSVAAAAPARTARLDATGICELTSIETRASDLLGRAALAADAAARIVVVTARDGERVTAALTFIDENGEAQPSRTMSAASCDELAESVAIVISLVLRDIAPPPPAVPLPRPVTSPPTLPSLTAVPSPPLPPGPSAPATETARDDSMFVSESAVAPTRALELGAATSSAAHTALVLGARLDRRRSAFAASLVLAMPERVDVLHGAVHVTSARTDIAGCLRAGRFAACGLVGGGLVRARGEDLMDARTAVRPLASLGLRAEWRQDLSRRVGVRLFATLEQLLVRPRFLVEDVAVWTEPLVQGWLGGGIFLRMP